MKKKILVMSLLIIMMTPFMTHAGQNAQKLGVCLSDSLNGKERKNLAKWVYFGMSTHSTISPYSNVTKENLENMSKYVGELITRLMTEDCPNIAKKAFKEDGALAFEYAFGIVGQVAMQELMVEPSVTQSLGTFEKYLDQDKFDKIFQ